MGGPECCSSICEASECVEAAEMLCKRALSLTGTSDSAREQAVWLAFRWHVDRATSILRKLKGETAVSQRTTRPRRPSSLLSPLLARGRLPTSSSARDLDLEYGE